MAKVKQKVLTEEEIEEQTPKIVGSAKKRVEISLRSKDTALAIQKAAAEVEPEEEKTEPAPVKVAPKVKKKQFELGESDMSFLNQNQFSEAAWESIGRRHGIDPATREALPGYKGRGFVAEPKKYAPLEPVTGGVLTSNGFQANSSTDGFINKKPISGKDSAAVQAELRGRKTLTVPITDEETTETV